MTTTGQRQAPDQIVVAGAHVRSVLQKLDESGIAHEVKEDSDELGLTLIDLAHDSVAAGARRVRAENGRLAADAVKHGEIAGGPSPDLTVVLKDLYENFRADPRYGGWVPTMGSNRIVIGPAHNINGGGEGGPRRADGALLRRSAGLGGFVRIGVADTAMYLHTLLDGSCLAARSQRWTPVDDRAPLASGHGTFVAGLILQQAPGATLVAEQILDADGQADSWEVAKSLVRFSRAGLQVLNLSIECATADGEAPLVLSTAIDRLGSGIQVVAAAGNHDPENEADDLRVPVWPAALDDVLAVTAHDGTDRIPDWSAPVDLPWVDCAARGVDLVSVYPPLRLSRVRGGLAEVGAEAEDALVSWSGTSFAAATVTGLIAVEIGQSGATAREATARLLREAKRTVADKPWLD